MKTPPAEYDWQTASHQYPVDHPTAAGHFPGQPLLPGALLLDRILRTIGLTSPLRLQRVKFLHPVTPGDRVTIRWRREAEVIHFELCTGRDETLSVQGTLHPGAA